MKGIRLYIYNNLIALDSLANTLLMGSPDDTLSGRSYAGAIAGHKWAKVAMKCINFMFRDANHCYHAYLQDGISRRAQNWNWGKN